MKYALLIYDVPGSWDGLSEEQQQDVPAASCSAASAARRRRGRFTGARSS